MRGPYGTGMSSPTVLRALRTCGQAGRPRQPKTRKVTAMRFIAFVLTALAPLLASFAQAQEAPSRVGRLAFIEGQVSLYQDPEEGWRRAYLNYPLTSENSIWTDRRSRAEMRVSGIAVRMDGGTQLDIARLDEDELNSFVAQGSVHVRVRHYENNHLLDFATPHARFRLYGVGRYRID